MGEVRVEIELENYRARVCLARPLAPRRPAKISQVAATAVTLLVSLMTLNGIVETPPNLEH